MSTLNRTMDNKNCIVPTSWKRQQNPDFNRVLFLILFSSSFQCTVRYLFVSLVIALSERYGAPEGKGRMETGSRRIEKKGSEQSEHGAACRCARSSGRCLYHCTKAWAVEIDVKAISRTGLNYRSSQNRSNGTLKKKKSLIQNEADVKRDSSRRLSSSCRDCSIISGTERVWAFCLFVCWFVFSFYRYPWGKRALNDFYVNIISNLNALTAMCKTALSTVCIIDIYSLSSRACFLNTHVSGNLFCTVWNKRNKRTARKHLVLQIQILRSYV